MSLAKAVFSGKVYREPQIRSTSNNVPITYFTFDIGTQGEEDLIRVRAVGNMAETVSKTIVKNERLVVEGNLMMSTIKTETGEEKKIIDLSLISFEKISGSESASSSKSAPVSEEIVKFADDKTDELIGEDEIPF